VFTYCSQEISNVVELFTEATVVLVQNMFCHCCYCSLFVHITYSTIFYTVRQLSKAPPLSKGSKGACLSVTGLLAYTSAASQFYKLSFAKAMLSSVDDLADLRKSEKAMPTTENSRSTVADEAGQPRYCRAMRARFGKRFLLAAHHLNPDHSQVFCICGRARYSASSSSYGVSPSETLASSSASCSSAPNR